MDTDKARHLTSPCGLPCFHCPAYLAGENGEIRAKMAAAMGVAEDKVVCEGCRPLKGRIGIIDPDTTCRVYLCAEERGIEFCHECNEFPCGRFQPYADKSHYPHNTKMYQLCMMKKLGFDRWAVEKASEIWDLYRTEQFDFRNILY